VARPQRGSTTRSAPSGVPLAIRHHRPVVATPGQRAPLPDLKIERTRVNSRTITQTNEVSAVRMDGAHGEKSRRSGGPGRGVAIIADFSVAGDDKQRALPLQLSSKTVFEFRMTFPAAKP
jgi:hypothetical protein